MPIQKIKSGRIITVQAPTYVGEKGTIFYDEDIPELRLSDGVTPGGIIFTGGGGGTGTYVLVTATNVRLGGIKVGSGLSITGDGTLSAIATSTYILNTASASILGGIKVGSGLSITGDGTLSAIATSTYILNTATASILGGIKVGAGLSINGSGVLTADVTSTYILNTATASILGGIKIGSGLVAAADGTVSAVSTSSYSLPIASTSTLGGIKVGSNLTIDLDGTLNANTATSGVSNSFNVIKINSQTDIIAAGADTLELVAGANISITSSATSLPYKSITISVPTFIGNLDGGAPDTIYGGTVNIDGGIV